MKTLEIPASVEDEIFIIDFKNKKILSATVKGIFTKDECMEEFEFFTELYCNHCANFESCSFNAAKCPFEASVVLGEEDDELRVVFSAYSSGYNKTWTTDYESAKELLESKND